MEGRFAKEGAAAPVTASEVTSPVLSAIISRPFGIG